MRYIVDIQGPLILSGTVKMVPMERVKDGLNVHHVAMAEERTVVDQFDHSFDQL